jgi:hypothetical protein
MGVVATVAGAVGGIGTSTFAIAIAAQAPSPCVLIDGQSGGVPIDLLLGAEQEPGIRWSQVQVRSSNIAADTIRAGLVARHGLFVLSADAAATSDPTALAHLVGALRAGEGSVVIDLPRRHPARAALEPELDLLLVPPTMFGVVAAGGSLHEATRLLLVETGRADVSRDQCEHFLGRRIGGVLRWQSALTAAATSGVLPPAGTDVMRVAAGLWQEVFDAQ